ncbi:hypothetical protein Emed_003080 [Eimeria media]
MEDAAPTRCPTEDTLHESAVSAALLSLAGKQERQTGETPFQKKAAAAAATLPGDSSSGALTAAAAAAAAGSPSSLPPLFALCELAADLQRVLKDVQGVQRQILQAQKSIAWVIGEPGAEALAVSPQQQQQQQEAQVKAAAVEAAFRLTNPASLTQQQQDVCSAASAAAVAAAASTGEGDASSLRSLIDLLGKQQQQQQQQQLDELEAAAAAARTTKLMKPLPLGDAAQWPLENTSAAAFMADATSYASKRGAFRSSCCPLEQQQQQQQLESEGGSHMQQQRMQSEESLSACGHHQRKRFKGGSGMMDLAPMPGVRFAKDRNSWVAFWCENGKQNYKSFSNKKFGPEMARLMAIAARQSFDDRSNNKAAAAAGNFLSSYSQRSPEQTDGCTSPADMLASGVTTAGGSMHGLSNPVSTSSSTSTRTPSGGSSEGGEEHQQLSRAEMQQLAASLGNPKGVCYAPSNNTWMAYGSMGSGARMCRSFPVSKFGFYGARRLAIKAVSQYQQKQQQQQQQQTTPGTCEPPSSSCVASVGPHVQNLASLKAPFDYTSALQLVVNRAGETTSPESYLRRRRMDSSRQLLHAAAGKSKASGELDLGALQQAAEHVAADVRTSAYTPETGVRGAAEECGGAPPAGVRCSGKAEAGSDSLMGSDLSMASALLLPLVASGRLMRFPEEESLLRSATDLSGLNVAREEAL